MQAGRAGAHGLAHAIQRGRAEQVAAHAQHGFGHLGTVQLWSAVHAAVADQHDVMFSQQPGRRLEAHVGNARAATQVKDWFGRMGRTRANSFYRQGDQACSWVGAPFGYHQRAAVRPVIFPVELYGAGSQENFAGLRPVWHADSLDFWFEQEPGQQSQQQ